MAGFSVDNQVFGTFGPLPQGFNMRDSRVSWLFYQQPYATGYRRDCSIILCLVSLVLVGQPSRLPALLHSGKPLQPVVLGINR
jgi:hypothetical protein